MPRTFRLLTALALLPAWLAAAPLTVIYPAPEAVGDTRDEDVIELLRLALDKTVASYGPYVLQPSVVMNENRYRESLRRGMGVSVGWLSVTADTEREFLAVPVPVRKGVLGYRVFIIRKQDLPRFAQVGSVQQLKALRVGQGVGWNDVPLLRGNGFNVALSQTYEGLFALLAAGRVDYLSRGINEAWREVAQFQSRYPDLVVEPRLMLYYPWPKYFYLNRKDKALAQRLEKGLQRAQQDGSFDALFRRFHQQDLTRANIAERQIFCIENPLFPDGIPPAARQMWYRPSQTFPCLDKVLKEK